MKLNIHILLDALTPFEARLTADDSIELDLTGIRNLPAAISDCSPDFIYIAEASQLQSFAATAPGRLTLLILGAIDDAFLRDRHWNAIIITGHPGSQVIFEKVMSIFEYYNRWEADLIKSIISGNSIQKQIDICAQVLDNPIALFDSSSILIAKAGSIPEDVSGTIWESVLAKGYWTEEYIPLKYRSYFESAKLKEHIPSIVPPLDEPAERRFIAAFMLEDKVLFATIGILDIIKKITRGQQSLVWQIQRTLENTRHLYSGLFPTSNGYSILIDQLFRGTLFDPQGLSYFLCQKNWSVDDQYYLLRFSLKDAIGFTPYNFQYYMFQIRQVLPDAFEHAFENAIFVIYRCKGKQEALTTIKEKLSPFLKKSDMLAGLSMKHTGYEFLRSAMLQSTAALKFGQHREPDPPLFLFQDIFSDYILDALSTTQDIHYYCHPIIQRMLHRRDPWELTLIHTLGVYIQNGQNASSAAAKVFVHRNTLLNRLSAIEKKFDIHFDSLDEETLQILYFSCFIAEKLSKKSEFQGTPPLFTAHNKGEGNNFNRRERKERREKN
jgi:hypothetical protein